jgi:hypothetical protein
VVSISLRIGKCTLTVEAFPGRKKNVEAAGVPPLRSSAFLVGVMNGLGGRLCETSSDSFSLDTFFGGIVRLVAAKQRCVDSRHVEFCEAKSGV